MQPKKVFSLNPKAKMSNHNNSSEEKQYIILDTNILCYIGDKILGDLVNQYLFDLLSRGFGLAISDISFFELLQGSNNEKENEGLDLLGQLKQFGLDRDVCITASRLTSLYLHEKNAEGKNIINDDQISTEDKLIASTAILTGSLVLTADVNDFPRPFFDEAEKKQITYQKRGREISLILELLKPDIDIIQQRLASKA